MSQIVAVLVGLAGIGLIVFGSAWAVVFMIARSGFERVLKAQLLEASKVQIADLADRIKNPLVRRLINRRAGEAVGAMAIALVRGELTSRFRVGLAIVAAGIAVFVVAFYVPSWWPR